MDPWKGRKLSSMHTVCIWQWSSLDNIRNTMFYSNCRAWTPWISKRMKSTHLAGIDSPDSAGHAGHPDQPLARLGGLLLQQAHLVPEHQERKLISLLLWYSRNTCVFVCFSLNWEEYFSMILSFAVGLFYVYSLLYILKIIFFFCDFGCDFIKFCELLRCFTLY